MTKQPLYVAIIGFLLGLTVFITGWQPAIGGIIAIISFVSIGSYFLFAQIKAQHLLVQQFAEQHGWQFVDKAPEIIIGSLAPVEPGATSFAKGPGMQGTMQGLPFWYYGYINSARDSSSIQYVISLKIPNHFPKFILDATSNNIIASNLSNIRARGFIALQLEGDFKDSFRVYIQPNSQVDVLEILTPEFMSILVDNGKKYDIEADGEYIHVIDSITDLITETNLNLLTDFSEELARRVVFKLQTFHASN